jgi:L-alanine-DL-glutamate epimerase-like enolase superfamily enzyme
MPRLRRFTAIPVRIPVPRERLSCPAFYHEPLNRGPGGGWDGPYFADVPFYIVKAEGDGGPAGWGDLVRDRTPEQIEAAARRLLGLAADEITADLAFTEQSPLKGLHTAALDWRARVEQRPLHTLFGPRVRDQVVVAAWNAFRTPAGLAPVVRALAAEGIRCLKLKSCLETDDPALAATVHAAAPALHLLIDPNARWATPAETLRRATAIVAAHPATTLEDPFVREGVLTGQDYDYAAHAEVRRRTGIGLVLTIKEDAQLLAAHAAGAVSGFNLEGTWPQLRRRAALAHERGLPFWAGSSVQSGLSDLAMLHFAVTQPAFTMPFEMAGVMYREHNLLRHAVPIVNGEATPPDRPGSGADPDEDALERYRVGDPLVIE